MSLTANYILANTTGDPEMRKHLCKSYIRLAAVEFIKKRGHWPTKENAQEVYNIYESQWRDHYIDKPNRTERNRVVGRPIWQYGCSIKIDVYASMCRFMEFKYTVHITNQHGNTYPEKNCAKILEEMKIEFMEAHIMENGLFDQWKTFALSNRSKFHYHKGSYSDFGHLAYNGVTDDL